ncbi:hypothetical protein RFI_22235 [Reticulomyxa filosa]|uniref:Uncharacterized protein n=1 Tax=Reticulomyxa filosa TaxID=46433 RepID=X6MMN7_RETFI|nr:hypothetical protein RFI_22235 [Reticulomyxa filosa]|eukprot:ETO15129.1 hypothetical protein RFI_22235 [Reticulomyxa filosa]
MATVNNISDKLQLALGFFFILEVDEWMYEVFINDFDVLDEEDFVIEDESAEADKTQTENKDVEKNQVDEEAELAKIWDKKARQAVRWGVVLSILMIWAVVYSAIVWHLLSCPVLDSFKIFFFFKIFTLWFQIYCVPEF